MLLWAAQGAMVMPIGGDHGKIDPAQLSAALSSSTTNPGAAYQPSAAVVSVTQPTEAGTLYTLEELKEICEIAHQHGVSVHMDGARLANAVRYLMMMALLLDYPTATRCLRL